MEDEINLLDYWRVIVKRKWIIIGLLIIAVLTGFVYNLREPKLYKATTTIMLVDSGSGALASAVSVFGNAPGGGESKLIPILKSATLSKRVARSFDLKNFFPEIYNDNKLTDEKKIGSVASILRGAVETNSSEGLLHVSMILPDPENVAEFANHYVKHLGIFLNQNSLKINFRVIDPAVSPGSLVKSRSRMRIVIGTLLGLFVGIFIAFFMEFIEKLPKSTKN